MAQGFRKNTATTSNKKTHKKSRVTKNRRPQAAKKAHLQQEAAVSKSINVRNERLVAAKVIGSGLKLSMSDVASKGQDQLRRQLAARNKKQANGKNTMTSRMKQQLEKLRKK